MTGYRLRPSAEADIEDIWKYTVQNWSFNQGQDYVANLFAAFVRLAENPGLGKQVDMVMPGYRQFRCGHHLIFYVTVGASRVDIARILHEKSDVLRHLDKR